MEATVANARLDAVAKAKTAYVIAKTTLEARLREQLREELINAQTQIDIAVRYAYDAGEKKADILRALGTKDYHTLNASLERTHGVVEVVGDDPLDEVFTITSSHGKPILTANFYKFGPNEYSGEARFTVARTNGQWFLWAETPLWNEDYTVRNDTVVALDGVTDGWYYEKVVEWLDKNHSQTTSSL